MIKYWLKIKGKSVFFKRLTGVCSQEEMKVQVEKILMDEPRGGTELCCLQSLHCEIDGLFSSAFT